MATENDEVTAMAKAKIPRFTPAEAMAATGLSKGQFSNRALKLGIQRDGLYTLDEVYQIVTCIRRYKSIPRPEAVKALRNGLTKMMEAHNDNLTIIVYEDGKARTVSLEG